MKMISNDLRSSCRALLLGAHQSGGNQKHDSIFHDILENSEELGTVDIDGNYKMTINFLFTDRVDLYGIQTNGLRDLYAQDGEGNRYDQQYTWISPRATLFAIFWRSDVPLYAVFINGDYLSIMNSYSSITVYKNSEDKTQYKQYVYPRYIYKYKKGSAALSAELSPSEIWRFRGYGNIKVYDPHITLNNANVNFQCNYKYYGADFPDETKPPKIHLSDENEVNESIYVSPFYSYPVYSGVFSDLTNDELLRAWDEIANAICMTYGGEACYKHERPELLLPTE